MNPLASFTFLIATAQRLVDAVNTRDTVYLRRPVALKAVAARLVGGMGVLRAYLRRLILLMALQMEWSLVDARGPMKRPHKRKSKVTLAGFSLKGLDADKVSPWQNGDGPQFKAVLKTGRSHGFNPAVPVNMARLYAQLDFLAGIAANPMARAKRLAFKLARTHQGIIMAPQGPKRIAGRWGTQVRASYDAMAASIMTSSRNRPPPLPPPRTHWPTIIAL